MIADRYVKIVLTVIALELLWLGVREGTPPVSAQQAPQRVVITGFQVGMQTYSAIPVAVVGGVKSVPPSLTSDLPNIEPLRVRITDPVLADIKQPVTVQTGNQPLTVQTGNKPILVDVVPAKPGLRPGL